MMASTGMNVCLGPRRQPAEPFLLVDVIVAVPAQVECRQPMHEQDVQDQQQLREQLPAHCPRAGAL